MTRYMIEKLQVMNVNSESSVNSMFFQIFID